MRLPDLSRATDDELKEVVEQFRGDGVNADAATTLAVALANSGTCLDWRPSAPAGLVPVDMPSTGGSSNKTPIVAPVLARAAAPDRLFVPKISSRGRTAGTIDILESVGYRTDLSPREYQAVVADVGISNVSQTSAFAPADERLMRVRRECGAMNVPALVVSSILSKKLATGCRNVVVDLKSGADSKFGDLAADIAGARMFLEVGRRLKEQGFIDSIWVAVSNSCRPQGRAFGRMACLWEALSVIAGRETGFLSDLCVALAARMLVVAGAAADLDAAALRCRAAVGPVAVAVGVRWLNAHGVSNAAELLAEPDNLLRDLTSTQSPQQLAGRLLGYDADRVAAEVGRISPRPGERYACGVILAQDPHLGLEGELSTTCLSARPEAWDGTALAAVQSAATTYLGTAVLAERPVILYDAAFCTHGDTESKCWTRTSEASIGAIRRPSGDCEYLLRWNAKWKQWNLVAGHREPDDADSSFTMSREISEELGPGELRCGHGFSPDGDFACASAGTHRGIWWSEAKREWSYYDLAIFDVRFSETAAATLEQVVAQNPDDLCWASTRELTAGRTRTGASIAAFPAVLLACQGRLPGSG